MWVDKLMLPKTQSAVAFLCIFLCLFFSTFSRAEEKVQSKAKPLPGHNAKVIGHWNVVPFQSIRNNFSAGIIGFHINGIDHVEFDIDGKNKITVKKMSLNPRTKTVEYWIPIEAADHSEAAKNGDLIEIRATIYPKLAGIPREMDVLKLHPLYGEKSEQNSIWVAEEGNDENGDGSKEKPFRQPNRAIEAILDSDIPARKATIFLMPGHYKWGSSKFSFPDEYGTEWLTLSAAPNVLPEEIIFTAREKERFFAPMVKISGVTIREVMLYPGSDSVSKIWIDESVVIGPGPTTGRGFYFSSNWASAYLTKTIISDYPNGATGFEIARNVTVRNIGSDAFSGSKLVVNSRVDGIDRGTTKSHPDVYQIYCGSKPKENFILYGLIARNVKAQGIFTAGCPQLDNVAIVNVLLVRPLESSPDTPFYSQWATNSNHVIISGTALPNSSFLWHAEKLENILLTGSVFYKISFAKNSSDKLSLRKNIRFEHLHVINRGRDQIPSSAMDISYGDAGFSDAAKGNFDVLPDAILANRVLAPFNNFDANGVKRTIPATIGPLE